MLKKCLKYDLKAVFRIWWIAAVSVLGLAVVCGLCVRRLVLNTNPNTPLYMESMVVASSVVGAIVFSLLSSILLIMRYYGNFFKDEGYLTFTLPVKRQTLFLSKLLSAIIVNLATGAVILVGICIVLLIAPDWIGSDFGLFYMGSKALGTESNMLFALVKEFGVFWTDIVGDIGAIAYLYALEAVMLAFFGMVMQSLLIYFCITMGAAVAKKLKILAAIGIYYGMNMAISFVQQVGFVAMMVWAVMGIGIHAQDFSEFEFGAAFGDFFLAVVALLLLIWILFYAIVSAILGFASLGTIERKLNLQ